MPFGIERAHMLKKPVRKTGARRLGDTYELDIERAETGYSEKDLEKSIHSKEAPKTVVKNSNNVEKFNLSGESDEVILKKMGTPEEEE